MAGITDDDKRLLEKFDLSVREYIFEPRLDIKRVGLFIDIDGAATLCLEVLWQNSVSGRQKREIESGIRLRIIGKFPELKGVEFFKVMETPPKSPDGIVRGPNYAYNRTANPPTPPSSLRPSQ